MCALLKTTKKTSNKFGAKREGGFASRLEAVVHQILLLRQHQGEISNLRSQHRVELTQAKIGWKVDFSFEVEGGKLCFAEAKGVEDARYRIFRKLWPYYGPGPLEIWKGGYRKPRLVEIIQPIAVT